MKEPGTPELESDLSRTPQSNVLSIRQRTTSPKNQYWSQQVDIKVVSDNRVVFETRTMIEDELTEIVLPKEAANYDFVLVNGSELGYGYFKLDARTKAYLLSSIHEIQDNVIRGAAWLALYEEMIRTLNVGPESERLEPSEFCQTLIEGLRSETETLNRENLLKQLRVVFWKLLSPHERKSLAPTIEQVLWHWVDMPDEQLDSKSKSTYYKSLVATATTSETIDRLYGIWKNESDVNSIKLSENDFIRLAQELALRQPENCDAILTEQQKRLKNEDRKKRFEFVAPSISPDQKKRDEFFDSLRQLKNRRPERWALEAMEFLNHPLRAKESEKYLLPSLKLLEEIQMTGDIFFPKRWLVAAFSGHRSKTAAQTVQRFLDDRPDFPFRLRNKILQAADLLLKVGSNQN